MKDVCVVYTDTGSGYSNVHKSNLRCRLAHIDQRPAATGFDRAQLAGRRKMIWDETGYAMPADCQIEVNGDGRRWNPVDDQAFGTFDGPSGTPVYRMVEVVVAA